MIELEHTLVIKKSDILNEVARTTSYTGANLVSDKDPNAYERIFTTDEDREALERFWRESKSSVCEALRRVLVSEDERNDIYTITVSLSSAFSEALFGGMQDSLRSYFVANIVAKWYVYTNKEEAAAYSTEAAGHLEDARSKALYKKQPERPVSVKMLQLLIKEYVTKVEANNLYALKSDIMPHISMDNDTYAALSEKEPNTLYIIV